MFSVFPAVSEKADKYKNQLVLFPSAFLTVTLPVSRET